MAEDLPPRFFIAPVPQRDAAVGAHRSQPEELKQPVSARGT